MKAIEVVPKPRENPRPIKLPVENKTHNIE